jgi:hypothetical protein
LFFEEEKDAEQLKNLKVIRFKNSVKDIFDAVESEKDRFP